MSNIAEDDGILSDEEIEALMKDFDADESSESDLSDESLSAQPDESSEEIGEELKSDIAEKEDVLSDNEIESLMTGFGLEESPEPDQSDQTLEIVEDKLDSEVAKEEKAFSDDEIEALVDVFGAEVAAKSIRYDKLLEREATLEILDIEPRDEGVRKLTRLSVLGLETDQAQQKKTAFFQDLCNRFEIILSTFVSNLLGGINVLVEKLPIGRSTDKKVVNSSFTDPENLSCVIMYPFDESKLKSCDLLELDLNLAFFMIDLRLSGDGGPVPKSKNKLTEFERTIISKIMMEIKHDLTQIWHPSVELVDPPRVLSYLDLAEISHQEQQVMSFPFKIAVQIEGQDPISGKFIVYIPHSIMNVDKMYINNIDTKAKSTVEAEDMLSQTSIQEKVMDIPLWLQVRFPPILITFGELLDLKKGDVVDLGITIQDKLNVKLQEKIKFLGMARLAENMKAIEICDIPSDWNSQTL